MTSEFFTEFIENLLFKTIRQTVDNVASQTSHLTFFTTEEKRTNYLFKKVRDKKLDRIISRGIL